MKKNYLVMFLSLALVCSNLSGCSFLEDDFEAEITSIELEEASYEEDNLEEYDAEAEEKSSEETDSEDIDEEIAETAVEESYPVGNGANINFDTVDVYGNPVSSDMIRDAKIVLLNLWEPWCGPCVSEMPDLNELYENYKDKGLLIIGVYETFEMDADARELVDKLGISYPIIKCNKSISKIEQDYVPATYILDHNGNLITEEPFAGSGSYSEWESVIREYLE